MILSAPLVNILMTSLPLLSLSLMMTDILFLFDENSIVSRTSMFSIFYDDDDNNDDNGDDRSDSDDDGDGNGNDTLVSLTSILMTLPLRSQNLYPK